MTLTKKQKRTIWVVAAIAGFIILTFAISLGYLKAQAAMKPHMDELMNIPSGKAAPDEEPYLSGKILPIDVSEKKIDSYVWSALPSTLLARRFEEVQTVVLLKYGESPAGSYTNGAGAFIKKCEVTIIDRTRGTVLIEQTLFGTSPPKTTTSRSGAYGSSARTAVVQFLKKLPRRG